LAQSAQVSGGSKSGSPPALRS